MNVLLNPTVRIVLGLLALLAALAASLDGHLLLVAGMLVLACAAFSTAAEIWRWALVGTLLLALGVAFRASFGLGVETATQSAIQPAPLLDPFALAGGAVLLLGLLLLQFSQSKVRRDMAQMQNVILALENGSARLADAKDASGVIRAGIQTLDQLKVAPNLAFVAYRRGTPHVLGAQGVFGELMGKPIVPGNGNADSRSVQADHWVVERVLSQIPREQRQYFLSIPVEGLSEQHLGLLLLTRPSVGPMAGRGDFLPEERGVITAFSRLFGTALGQWQAIRELRDANELTLRSLGSALEQRDDETGGHTARVVALSEQLARRLGWKEDAVKALRWGAYLHDLGKLAIPDSILHKPGPLTPEERHIMQRHTIIGYDMLQDLHFLPAETLDLVRYHHERWDGAGYPSNLRTQDIPSTARVFSIVDVYDALTSSRPYKNAWTRERALSEIKLQGGRQFDPQYVESFLGMMTEQDDAKLVR